MTEFRTSFTSLVEITSKRKFDSCLPQILLFPKRVVRFISFFFLPKGHRKQRKTLFKVGSR